MSEREIIDGLLIRSVPLGGSALSQAAQRGAVSAWYARCPETPAEWLAHATTVRASHDGAGWFDALSPAFAATGPAADRLTRAADGGVIVTTGQQPGLFGGPTYTFSKAISALAVANALEEATGLPVAPVFWAASDDADWLEAAVTHVATARGLSTASLVGPATEGVAMADVSLGDLQAARAVLAAGCGSVAHPSILDLVDAAYVPHATIGAAYVQLLRGLLEPLGIAVLDAAHPTLRRAADGFLRDALRHAGAVHEALTARGEEIREAGHEAQVDVVDGLSLVFRSTLASKGDAMQRTRERVPLAEAGTVAREAEAGTLGANVLLRPVLERALLPTVCYLAGPGEYAYFAQVAPVAQALGAAVPVAAPRWACELIETRVRARQQALAIDDAALRDPHAAEQVVARAHVDEAVADMIERLRVTLETQVRAVQETLVSDDAPVAESVVRGLARDLAHKIDRFERRVLAGVKQRESDALREVAALRAALRPNGTSPERVLNFIPMLARFGPGVFTAMLEESARHARHLAGLPSTVATTHAGSAGTS